MSRQADRPPSGIAPSVGRPALRVGVFAAVVALAGCVAAYAVPRPEVRGIAERVATRAGFVEVATAERALCARTANGETRCWGESGSSSFDRRPMLSEPTSVLPVRFQKLTVGPDMWCGIAFDGAADCWGRDFHSGAATADPQTPRVVSVETTQKFTMLTLSKGVRCGLNGDGFAYCWGLRAWLADQTPFGLGTGRKIEKYPARVLSTERYAAIANGLRMTCAIRQRTGAVDCWGDTPAPAFDSARFVRGGVVLPPPPRFTAIVAGTGHFCALAEQGAVYCWLYGSRTDPGVANVLLGNGGDTVPHPWPARVASAEPFRRLTAGAEHTCALTAAGRAFCWGKNDNGQLGDGTLEARGAPVPVATSLSFTQISAGPTMTCAVAAPHGAVYCWGAVPEILVK
jgi:Regulator of chromosome condensation (RCC1) repeat